MNYLEMMRSPLVRERQAAPFLRQVLAEVAMYGVPPQVIATLDDIAAILGFYDPLPAGQSGHLAGPIVEWRTNAAQPSRERILDVMNLAAKQRALVAFGAAPASHMIGTAEIVCAMGNLHKELPEEISDHTVPKDFYEVFTWASVDVLGKLGADVEEAFERNKWPRITDDEVLKPGGRLHPTYIKIATDIRRNAIAVGSTNPMNPRKLLRPLAKAYFESNRNVLAQAEREGLTRVVEAIERNNQHILAMYPGIDQEKLEAEGDAAA